MEWHVFCKVFSKNGVKQGGVISPVLFCIYIDKLLLELSKSGFGCFIGEVFLEALVYADDIVLLAPTHRAMQNMLVLCNKYANEYHVVFNAKKSKCLYINSCANCSCISATIPHFSVGSNHIRSRFVQSNGASFINCITFNARSIMNKLPEWYHLIYACSYDVIFVTESWFNDDVPTSLRDPDDCFDVFRCDWKASRGGGACCLVSKNTKYTDYYT